MTTEKMRTKNKASSPSKTKQKNGQWFPTIEENNDFKTSNLNLKLNSRVSEEFPKQNLNRSRCSWVMIGHKQADKDYYFYIYTLVVCLSVCLNPINIKTAEPIGPKFSVGFDVNFASNEI